jgi:hypothetical protein
MCLQQKRRQFQEHQSSDCWIRIEHHAEQKDKAHASCAQVRLHRKREPLLIFYRYNQLLRDSNLVRLGGRCGKRCVPPEDLQEGEEWTCWEHALLPITKVIVPNGHLTAVIRK